MEGVSIKAQCRGFEGPIHDIIGAGKPSKSTMEAVERPSRLALNREG